MSGPTAPATTVASAATSSASPPGCWPRPTPTAPWWKTDPTGAHTRPADAASLLLGEVDAGRLGRTEVDAVLAAAGQATRPPQVSRPAGLTEREVDVLRLIARGLANKEVAARLGISPKTVGHHIEHIYAKAGVTTRAGATLFAMEHGLAVDVMPMEMMGRTPDAPWRPRVHTRGHANHRCQRHLPLLRANRGRTVHPVYSRHVRPCGRVGRPG